MRDLMNTCVVWRYFFDISLIIMNATHKKHTHVVNFLDVTLNLTNGTYSPYHKPESIIQYINTKSNHPLCLKTYLNQLNKDSAEDIFLASVKPYQDALYASGFKHKLSYIAAPSNNTKCRKRKILWFNPPFSMDVETNVGKQSLDLLYHHFPPGHILHSVLNRSTQSQL